MESPPLIADQYHSTQVDGIKRLLEESVLDVDQVKSFHSQILSNTSFSERKALEDKLSQLVSKLKKNTETLRNEIEGCVLRKEGKWEENEMDNNLLSKEELIQQNNSLLLAFFDLAQSYKNTQEKFLRECKECISERIPTEGSCSKEEMEKIMEEEDFSFYKEQPGGGIDESGELEERQKKLKELNETIRELHKLMDFLSSHLKEKLKLSELDNAEDDVQLAGELVLDSDVNLEEAGLWRKILNRKKYYLLLFVMFLGVILGILLYASIPSSPELPKPLPHLTRSLQHS